MCIKYFPVNIDWDEGIYTRQKTNKLSYAMLSLLIMSILSQVTLIILVLYFYYTRIHNLNVNDIIDNLAQLNEIIDDIKKAVPTLVSLEFKILRFISQSGEYMANSNEYMAISKIFMNETLEYLIYFNKTKNLNYF